MTRCFGNQCVDPANPGKPFDNLNNVKNESNQKLSILFWLFKAKASKDGKAPIYARITLDGVNEEISLGLKFCPSQLIVDSFNYCSFSK